MSKKTKIILIIASIVVVIVGGFFLLPDCKYLDGGFYGEGGGPVGKMCHCTGWEFFYKNNAPSDGVSASKCIGKMTIIME